MLIHLEITAIGLDTIQLLPAHSMFKSTARVSRSSRNLHVLISNTSRLVILSSKAETESKRCNSTTAQHCPEKESLLPSYLPIYQTAQVMLTLTGCYSRSRLPPVAVALFGVEATLPMALLITIENGIVMPFTVSLLEIDRGARGHPWQAVSAAFRAILRNPVVMSVLVGSAVGLLGIPYSRPELPGVS